MIVNGYEIKQGANLHCADLRGADLCHADLCHADLSGANLNEANLSGADLSGAYLRNTNLTNTKMPPLNTPEGDVIGYKKLANGTVAKLLIKAHVRRTASYVGNKLRAESALCIEGEGKSWTNMYYRLSYSPGVEVNPTHGYDDDPRVECAPGIHFFLTRKEAEDFGE